MGGRTDGQIFPGRSVNCVCQKKKMRPQGFSLEKKWWLALVPADWAKEYSEQSREGNCGGQRGQGQRSSSRGADAFGSRLQISCHMGDWSPCGKISPLSWLLLSQCAPPSWNRLFWVPSCGPFSERGYADSAPWELVSLRGT